MKVKKNKKPKDDSTKSPETKDDSKEIKIEKEGDDENIADIGPEEGKRKATEIDKERKREKNRLKRQRKKEKRLNSKVGKPPSDVSQSITRDKTIEYLKLWKNDREKWKFNKKYQRWLLKNIYLEKELEDQEFQTLLEYFVGLKGEARQRVIKEAETIVQSSEEKTNAAKSKRAKEILQLLD